MRDAFENKTETITFTVEEATMRKLYERFEDVNVNECPYFDVKDRYGNAARYYREDAYPKTGKRTAETAQNVSDSDLIYRKAAIDAIERAKTARSPDGEIYVAKINAQMNIQTLPFAQPERKKGKWIYGEDDGQDGWYCSECNGFVPWDYEYYGLKNIDFIDDFKVCPFCEADMVSRTGSERRESC